MKYYIKDYFNKCDQIRRNLQIYNSLNDLCMLLRIH